MPLHPDLVLARRRAAPTGYRWSDDAIDDALAPFDAFGVSTPHQRDVYAPDARQLLPPAGAWALVVRQPPALAGGLDRRVTPGRVFFVEREPGSVAEGFAPNGTYKAVLRSPWGDVKLWPYEYAVVAAEFVLGCWQAGELEFHPLHVEAARFADVTHYARARGIPLAAAAAMALGTVAANVGWFEPTPTVAAAAAAVAAAPP